MKLLRSLRLLRLPLLLIPFLFLVHNVNDPLKGQGTSQVQVNPDCTVVNVTLTLTSGSGSTITVPGGNGFDNRTLACQSYVLEYVATATSGTLTSVLFQAAGGAVTPGSFSGWGGDSQHRN